MQGTKQGTQPCPGGLGRPQVARETAQRSGYGLRDMTLDQKSPGSNPGGATHKARRLAPGLIRCPDRVSSSCRLRQARRIEPTQPLLTDSVL